MAGAALVVVAVTMIVTGRGSSTAGAGQTAQAKEISALFAGIPQSGNTLGPPASPVTLQFFGDLQCRTARVFALVALPYIIREWVRPGTVRIEFRSMRSVSEPEIFSTQQVAAMAAGAQDKLWYYLESFYHEQGSEHSGYVTDSYLASIAREVSGLNLQQWSEDRNEPQLAAQVAKDEQTARAAHLSGTPSFLIGRTGSAPLFSLGESSTLEEIDDAILHALRDQKAS